MKRAKFPKPLRVEPYPQELTAVIHGKGGGTVAVVYSGSSPPSMEKVMGHAAKFAASDPLLAVAEKWLSHAKMNKGVYYSDKQKRWCPLVEATEQAVKAAGGKYE